MNEAAGVSCLMHHSLTGLESGSDAAHLQSNKDAAKVGHISINWKDILIGCINHPAILETIPICCRSSGVEHVLGKDGVGGSIPLGSTSFLNDLAIQLNLEIITGVISK